MNCDHKNTYAVDTHNRIDCCDCEETIIEGQEAVRLLSQLALCVEALEFVLEVRAFYRRSFGDEIVGEFGKVIAHVDDKARAALRKLR